MDKWLFAYQCTGAAGFTPVPSDSIHPNPAPIKEQRRGERLRRHRASGGRRRYSFHQPKHRWVRRVEKALAVARLPGALFVGLRFPSGPTEAERRLALVSRETHAKARAFKEGVRRAGATYAITLATRARGQHDALFVHVHAVLHGLDAEKVKALAKRAGLVMTYCEPVREPERVALYMLGARQSKSYDAAEGRVFWSNAGAGPKLKAQAPEPAALARALESAPYPTGPVRLGPGRMVVDAKRFVSATVAALCSLSRAVRDAAMEDALAYLVAIRLSTAPAPLPPSPPPPSSSSPPTPPPPMSLPGLEPFKERGPPSKVS